AADEEDETTSTSPLEDWPARPGRFRAAGPRAVALPAALQSGISGMGRAAPARFLDGKVWAEVAWRRPSAPTRAESGTGLAVYRLVQWLSRTGRPEPENASSREAMVAGTTVAVGRLQDAALRVHARAGAGHGGQRRGARAAHACVA